MKNNRKKIINKGKQQELYKKIKKIIYRYMIITIN